MPGLLDISRPGLLASPNVRQVRVPGQPGTGVSPFMGMGGMGQGGGPPAYGSDEWALTTGGPGAMMWRELIRGLQSQGLGALAPGNAGKVFSPEYRALLGPEYQKGSKGGRSAR